MGMKGNSGVVWRDWRNYENLQLVYTNDEIQRRLRLPYAPVMGLAGVGGGGGGYSGNGVIHRKHDEHHLACNSRKPRILIQRHSTATYAQAF